MSMNLSAIPGVLTVEISADSVSGEQVPPPALDRAAAERLGQAMAGDLQRILGPLDRYGLVVLGALYDTTEILRPGPGMVDLLMELYRRSLPDTGFTPRIITIGSHEGRFPIPELAPRRGPESGPLLAVPFLLLGQARNMDALESLMEKRLLETGRASHHSEEVIRDAFGVSSLHLSYATFNDLCALMRVQLDHAGFGPLWQLLEGALFPTPGPVRAILEEGNVFLLQGDTAYTLHLGVAAWARRQGMTQAADTSRGYGRYLLRQRQYAAGLRAHGIHLQTVPTGPDTALLIDGQTTEAYALAQISGLPADSDRLREFHREGELEGAHHLQLTEHWLPELGPVAYTLRALDAAGGVLYQVDEYPLLPEAVTRIPAHWRDQASELGIPLQEHHPGVMQLAGSPPGLCPRID